MTWYNSTRATNHIYQRLGICMANVTKMSEKPIKFEYIHSPCSNHRAMIVSLQEDNQLKGNPFKFLEMWLSHEKFKPFV